ncbi:hypothetical protein D0U03_19840 [Bacillus velezensis]|nr:hypothetical protein D0U03_19840 [Bacillus velezensis]
MKSMKNVILLVVCFIFLSGCNQVNEDDRLAVRSPARLKQGKIHLPWHEKALAFSCLRSDAFIFASRCA